MNIAVWLNRFKSARTLLDVPRHHTADRSDHTSQVLFQFPRGSIRILFSITCKSDAAPDQR